jgi:beta-lactamase regulating signal transducer with metallopeptidase domain
MMGIDTVGWLACAWSLLLAFTAGLLTVAVLRNPVRRWFGAEIAYRFWLLPPLALLASVLPHAAAPVLVLTPVMQVISLPLVDLQAPMVDAGVFDWRAGTLLLWLSGVMCSLSLAAMAQWRYRRQLRDATVIAMKPLPYPVLLARATYIGPAMVGAWRRCIVLPADFEYRYSREEQSLILAHETIHARRFDGIWCLLGRLLAALFWFHPLAWWALAAFRQDQELACDAAVLRERGAPRRLYADAMLKARPAAGALPAGCSWAARHPLMERIAMLKAKQPGVSRRRLGWMVMFAAGAGLTAAVYAAAPATQVRAAAGTGDRYTLAVDVSMGGSSNTWHFTQCVKRGEPVDLHGDNTPALSWKGRFAVSSLAQGQLEIRAKVATRFDRGGGTVREESAEPVVRTRSGQPATIVFGQVVKDEHDITLQDGTIKLVLTPSPGCTDAVATRVPHAVHEYQLNTSVEFTTGNGHSDSVRRATFAICTISGREASFKVKDWMFDVTPVSTGGDDLKLQLKVSDATHPALAQATLKGAVNGLLNADGVSADGKSRYVMKVTPLPGCPSREKPVAQQARA